MARPTEGWGSPIWPLTVEERTVFVEADMARRMFTLGKPASMAVRMAFWEIEAARVWPKEFSR